MKDPRKARTNPAQVRSPVLLGGALAMTLFASACGGAGPNPELASGADTAFEGSDTPSEMLASDEKARANFLRRGTRRKVDSGKPSEALPPPTSEQEQVSAVPEPVITESSQPPTSNQSQTSNPVAGSWDVTFSPPEMSSPRIIEIPRDIQPVSWPAYSILCSGSVYQIKLGANEDAVIRFSGTSPLKYPLWIDGGRNVRVIGLHMELEVQPGCGVGQLPNIGGSSNVHPRVPGGMALRLEQSRTSFVEGAYIDVKGTESDCIVIRNPDSMSGATARQQRDIVIQNTACHGIAGLGKSDIGDGEHGDIIQNQGDDVMRLVALENVSARSASEGVMLHSNQGFHGAVEFVLRRFDYAYDARYTAKTKYDGPWGLPLYGWADKFVFDSIWLNDYNGGNYVIMNDQRYGVSTSSSVLPHSAIRAGSPPNGPFAPASRVGMNYASPHRVP